RLRSAGPFATPLPPSNNPVRLPSLRGLRVGAFEPLDGVVVLFFAIQSEAGLVQRFRTGQASGEPIDDVDQMDSGFRPMTIEEIDSGPAQRVEFVRFGACATFQFIQAERRLQRVIVARTGEELEKGRGRVLCISQFRVSLAQSSQCPPTFGTGAGG